MYFLGNTIVSEINVEVKDLPNLGIGKFEQDYFVNLKYMHIHVGVLERTPPPEEDDTFPTYLPIGMPEKYVKFYYDNITLSKDETLCEFCDSYDRFKVKSENNALRKRINVLYSYEIATYAKHFNGNWNYKLSNIYNKSSISHSYTLLGKLIETKAIEVLFHKTGCATQLSGTVINPNAPYIGYANTGIAYCFGKIWMVDIRSPIVGRKNPIHVTLQNVSFLKYNRQTGEVSLRPRHKYYGSMQVGMAVTKVKQAIFAIYNGFDQEMKVFYVPYNKHIVNPMIDRLYSVYFSKMLPRIYKNTYVLD